MTIRTALDAYCDRPVVSRAIDLFVVATSPIACAVLSFVFNRRSKP